MVEFISSLLALAASRLGFLTQREKVLFATCLHNFMAFYSRDIRKIQKTFLEISRYYVNRFRALLADFEKQLEVNLALVSYSDKLKDYSDKLREENEQLNEMLDVYQNALTELRGQMVEQKQEEEDGNGKRTEIEKISK
jgi:hypothetical protein